METVITKKNFQAVVLMASFFVLSVYLFVPHLAAAAAKINLSKATNMSGLAGYWSFDGNAVSGNLARDLTGGGNDASSAGNLSLTAGKIGQATTFNGSASATLDAGSALPLVGDISISVWVFPFRNNGVTYLISKGISADIPYQIVTDSSASPKINFLRYDDLSPTIDLTSNSSLQLNAWNHIAVTSNQNSDSLIYINGIQDAANTGTHAPTDIGSDLYFGSFNGASNFFEGKMDDIRIYNRVLSTQEVKKLYNAGQAKQGVSTKKRELGLAGYWTFDNKDINWAGNTIQDTSGNGNTGTLTGMSAAITPSLGKRGQAFRFDGSDDEVDIGTLGDNVITENTPFSISLWTKPGRFTFSNYLVNRTPISGFTFDAAPSGQIRFFQQGSTNLVRNSNTGALTLNQWSHVVATWTGSLTATDIHIYVDGVEVSYAQTQDGVTLTNNTGSVVIGETYLGDIDDVRIYSRPLSLAEVQQLYNSGSGKVNVTSRSSSDGLVGWWTFDGPDVSGTTASDRAGAVANNGTLIATTTIGRIGQGVRFNGNDSYVTIADDSTDLRPAQFTLSAWFSVSSFATFPTIIAKPRTSAPWSSPFTSWLIRLNGATTIEFGLSNAGYSGTTATTFGTLIPNTWYHIAMTYDGATRIGYLNGVSILNNSLAGPIGYAAQPVMIGADHGASPVGDDFDGIIDDVRIYSRALTPADILQLYRMSK